MNDSTCPRPCLMKLDLQDSTDKLAFLKDNWPSFGQIESIDKLSKHELKCTLCFLDVLIDEFVDDEYVCSSRVMTRLVLKWMNTPENLLPDSTLYVRIYFAGLLFIFVYIYLYVHFSHYFRHLHFHPIRRTLLFPVPIYVHMHTS